MSRAELTFPLVPRRRIAGLPFGAMHSRRRGPGSDLAGARPYRPGDDVRRIDWRASARFSSARSRDEFVVREHLTEEAARVVLVVDRRPAMALFPEAFPWLRKPAAIAVAGSIIVDSALRARCLVGYLDVDAEHRDGDEEHRDGDEGGRPFLWHPPDGTIEPWRLKERYLSSSSFSAPEDSLARALEHLVRADHAVPPGTFVFLLSDFLVVPGEDVWAEALARRFDIVPVVIQDPLWEQSFPDVAGAVLPLSDPAGGPLRLTRVRRRDVTARKRAHEARLAAILARFEAMDLDAVLISGHDPGPVLQAFRAWADGRQMRERLVP